MAGRGNRLVGNIGEKYASEFLKQRGYRIVETNARTPLGEIDIVAGKGPATVFVEVKTRLTSSLGPPYISVTKIKQRHIINNALCYLKHRGLLNSPWQIDIVSVKLGKGYGVESIELIENAVEANY